MGTWLITMDPTPREKQRRCLDMRPIAISKKVKRIRFEESMGAYWYHETFREKFRTLRSPESGRFARQSHPTTQSDKAGNNPSCLPT